MNDLNELSVEQIFVDIDEALESGRGASFLRFNDGEGKVSGCPQYYSGPALCAEIRTHFGTNSLTNATFDALRGELNAAICNADWVGVPPAEWPPLFAKARSVLDQMVLPENKARPKFTHVSFPQMMLDRGMFDLILKNRKFVGLIGCRDLRQLFKDLYGCGRVEFLKVPEQGGAAYSDYLPPHFPSFSRVIVESISVPFPGALFLVGAGFCGKLYANAIKRKGGVAIDVGSLMDLWAGRFTRPYMNFDQIVSYYLDRQSRGDNSAATLHALADYHRLKDDVEGELLIVDGAVQQNPLLFDFQYRRIDCLVRLGRIKEASSYCADVTNKIDFGSPAVYRFAKVFLNAGERHFGCELLSAAFNKDPTYEPVVAELTNFCMPPSKDVEAHLLFSFGDVIKTLFQHGQNFQIASQYARFLGSRGFYDSAIDVAKRSVELFSYDPSIYRQKAAWEAHVGRTDDAAASVSAAEVLEDAGKAS